MKRRTDYVGVELLIDANYLGKSLDTLQELCHACHAEIKSTYARYTKVKALRELWDYIFDSPILRFDDCWVVREDEDSVHLKKTKFPGASSSEEMFLAVWLNHYNGSGDERFKSFHLKRLSERRQHQFLWLLSTLRNFQMY